MKLIGKGAFSKVYDNGDNTVTIKTKDWAKEALALWVDNDRFPKVERLDYDEISTYKMKKFDKVKAIKRDLNDYDYALYTYLRKNVCASNLGWGESHDYSTLYEAFSNMPEGFKEDAQKLIDALDEMSNYGQDVSFEISPRNVFIENGRLIFADVFFFQSQLAEVREEERQKLHNKVLSRWAA